MYETFEGGHLIPHKYFESDQGEAANYPSIMVPMSRTMNIGINNTWKDIENNLESYLQRSHDQKCTISINITRPEWNLYSEVLEKMLFDNFELTDDNKSESIGTSIIPEKINVSVSYFNGEELSLFPNIPPFKKRDCFSHSASENNIHNTYSAINNGIEFFDVLVNSPFYTRFSPQFRYALWVFCKSTSDISPDMSSAGQ